MDRVCFLLESCGRTATNWITEALNRHPDFFTTHGIDVNPRKVDHNIEHDYRRDPKNVVRNESELHLDDYFDILEKQPHRFIGSIHGYNAAVPYGNPGAYRRRYVCAAITRHPVLRVASIRNQIRKELSLPTEVAHKQNAARRQFVEDQAKSWESLKAIVSALGIDVSDTDTNLFLCALIVVVKRDGVNLFNGMPLYLMERLTNEPDNFCHLASLISNGQAVFSEAFVCSILGQEKRFASPTERSGLLEYQLWQPWQREVFANLLEDSNLLRGYQDLGYDLSYVR